MKNTERPWAQILFICCVFALLVAPAVGMLGTRGAAPQSTGPAAFPRLAPDGKLNTNFLSQAGSWFEAHFAGRDQMITANAALQAKLLKVSATDQVVLGSGGWLYYAGDLNGYVGAAPLSEHALANIAHNLALMQRYTEAQGARFVFAIAPDKAQLYPDQMPARYRKSPRPSDAERLVPYLQREGVHYVDLFAALSASSSTGDGAGPLYLTGDSHWNNKGALIASDALASAAGLTLQQSGAWITRDDMIGDLELMLHPAWPRTEPQYYLPGINDGPGMSGASWRYTSAARDVTADLVTTSAEASATLLVYRDSFGNALLPYLAAGTGKATFSKLVPYNALQIGEAGADAVIVERAQRHLSYLAQQPPIMPAPRVELDTTGAIQRQGGPATSAIVTGANGPLTIFSGRIDPRIARLGSRIFVGLVTASGDEKVYEAFTTSSTAAGDSGFIAAVLTRDIDPGATMVKAYVVEQGQIFLASSAPWRIR
ncbi:MAG: hypothetical protein FWC48_00235 [Actinomycetia bacterium]|nr:hypothetical protein [Actinomycetes bacterium]